MGFLDDMTSEEKEHLEEALQYWKRAEDRVPHPVQTEYTQRFPLPGNADRNLWQALQNIYARQLQDRVGEPWMSGPSAAQAATETDLYAHRYVVLRAQDPRLSSIEETDFEVSEVPERSIWENQYGSVDESWARDPAEAMRALFKRENETKPVPPQQKLLCTAEQWDEAVAYRDLPPEQKATADAPVLAIALGWAPISWSKP